MTQLFLLSTVPSDADMAPTFDYRLLSAHSLLHPQSPCVQGLVKAIDKKALHLAIPLPRDQENLYVSPRHHLNLSPYSLAL